MKESEIAETLENAGFVLQPKRGTTIDAGRPTLRYSREGIRGSFYATDNYLSATGPYKLLRDKVSSSRENHQHYPVWQGDQLAAVLTAVLATYADADQQPPSQTKAETKPATGSGTSTVAAVTDAVERTTTAPSGTDLESGMETGAGTEVQPGVIAASEADTKATLETETTTGEKADAATAVQANGKAANPTESVTESAPADPGGLLSLYTSFWRMVGIWLGGTKPKG